MEPSAKRTKITDHFRVALKPQDHNVHSTKQQHFKENIEIITISDDFDNNNSTKKHAKKFTKHSLKQQHQHVVGKDIKNLLQQQQTQQPPPLANNQSNLIKNLLQQQQQQQQQPPPLANQSNLIKNHHHHHHNHIHDNHHHHITTTSSKSKKVTFKETPVNKVNFKETPVKKLHSDNEYTGPPGITENIIDHDATVLDNVFCEPHYAWHSFNYDREREAKFKTLKYLDMHEMNHQITPRIRARLIDWLVDIQNDFRLDHEPLYMAVKLADQYLMRKTVLKQNLELLYMTSIFISVKFDYRPNFVTISELVQEFGGKYNRRQVINFEIDILTTLNFDIRFPLSYGFLRRFARCTNSNLQTLTLARYILESSLLEYEMIDILESKIAAASLLLANKMLLLEMTWSEAAEFYTGYKETELDSLVLRLNDLISRPPDRKISAIKRKYSSEVFMSVATVAPLVT